MEIPSTFSENPKSAKQTNQAPKLTILETTATRDNRELTRTFTRAKLNQESTPVKPVRGTGQTSERHQSGRVT
jgi:hypothetical protein